MSAAPWPAQRARTGTEPNQPSGEKTCIAGRLSGYALCPLQLIWNRNGSNTGTNVQQAVSRSGIGRPYRNLVGKHAGSYTNRAKEISTSV
eukprot:4028614-Heterocapsa_arctica.AAC.1